MDKSLSLLGMACRAGKLALGHDAALDSLKRGKSSLRVICSDSSQRLVREFARSVDFYKSEAPVEKISATQEQLSAHLPKKVGVISVEDGGFADRFLQLSRQE